MHQIGSRGRKEHMPMSGSLWEEASQKSMFGGKKQPGKYLNIPIPKRRRRRKKGMLEVFFLFFLIFLWIIPLGQEETNLFVQKQCFRWRLCDNLPSSWPLTINRITFKPSISSLSENTPSPWGKNWVGKSFSSTSSDLWQRPPGRIVLRCAFRLVFCPGRPVRASGLSNSDARRSRWVIIQWKGINQVVSPQTVRFDCRGQVLCHDWVPEGSGANLEQRLNLKAGQVLEPAALQRDVGIWSAQKKKESTPSDFAALWGMMGIDCTTHIDIFQCCFLNADSSFFAASSDSTNTHKNIYAWRKVF